MRTGSFVIGLLLGMPAYASTVQSYDLWLEFSGQEDFHSVQYCDYTSLDPVCSPTPQSDNPLRPVGPFSDLAAGDLIRFTAMVEKFGFDNAGSQGQSTDCRVGRHDCSGSTGYSVTNDPDSFEFWFEIGSSFRFVGETALGSAVSIGLHDKSYYDETADYSVSWGWDYHAYFSVAEPLASPDPDLSAVPLPAPLGFLMAGLLGLGVAGRARRRG